MKILYFADSSDIHTYRWIEYFATKGHEIHVLSFNDSKSLTLFDNVFLYSFRKNTTGNEFLLQFMKLMNLGSVAFNPFYVLNESKRIIKKVQPDVIHGHSIIHHTIIAALTNFHPFIASAWGNDVLIYPCRSKIVRYAVQLVLKRADLITSEGENSKDAMVLLGAKPDKIQRILHGVDIKMFAPVANKDDLRNELNILNFPTVISTRRMSKIHDVETLIRSIPYILNINPVVRFLFIGNGSERVSLEKLTVSLSIQNNVSFIGDVPHETLSKYLASADIYVSTSLSDSGIAVSTLEAMSCGTAPIITNIADNNKWVMDGINGFVIPPENPRELAKKILTLLENKEMRYEFGKKSRSIIIENADYYKEMEKMENLYKYIIQRCKK